MDRVESDELFPLRSSALRVALEELRGLFLQAGFRCHAYRVAESTLRVYSSRAPRPLLNPRLMRRGRRRDDLLPCSLDIAIWSDGSPETRSQLNSLRSDSDLTFIARRRIQTDIVFEGWVCLSMRYKANATLESRDADHVGTQLRRLHGALSNSGLSPTRAH